MRSLFYLHTRTKVFDLYVNTEKEKADTLNKKIQVFFQNQNLLAALLLALIIIIFYRDVVFNGRTFLIETGAPGTLPSSGFYKYGASWQGLVAIDPGSTAWVNEPYNKFASISIKNGDFPLWNPYAGLAGSPFLADGQTGPLEPLQFLFFFVPDKYWPYSIDLQLLLRFFISGYFCYLFARRQKIDFLGGISASVIFLFSSYFVGYGNHAQIKTEALLPLVLYGYDRLANLRDNRGIGICALFIGWAIIAAMPESTFFVLLLGSLWYFYKSTLQSGAEKKLELYQFFIILGRFLVTAILGLAISAAYLLPFLEFVGIAKSIHTPGASSATFHLSTFFNLVFPASNILYLRVGFFPLLCLVLSIRNTRSWSEHRSSIFFFSSYAILFIFTIYDFPITNWIKDLPIFNQLYFSKYPIPSIVFCLAILAGITIDKTSISKVTHKDVTATIVAILIISSILFFLTNASEYFLTYTSNNSFLIISVMVLMIFSFFALYILIYRYKSSAINLWVLQIGVVMLAMLEPFYWGLIIHRPERSDPYPKTSLIKFLKQDKKEFRIFGLDGIIYPDIATAYQLADIRWLNPLVQQRAYDFSQLFIESAEIEEMRLTGTVLPISDEMFDLLNVKYVLSQTSSIEDFSDCLLMSENRPYFGENTIHSQILKQNRENNQILFEQALNTNGLQKTAILAHPPQKFSVNLIVPKEALFLNFSIGLNQEIFSPEKGDGVGFHISIIEGEKEQELFFMYIDPKNNHCERKWFEEHISVKKWAGKKITLLFSTDPGPLGDESWDWAYWGSINFSTMPDQILKEDRIEVFEKYTPVYKYQNISVFQNNTVLPRAFIVHNVVNVPNFDTAIKIMDNGRFNLQKTAIVEELPTNLENLINTKEAFVQEQAQAKQFSSDSIQVKVSTQAPGLLILTDQYYPGWNAYVNGIQKPIFAVNGIFRGVFLEKGNYIIEFKYEPSSFTVGLILTTTSLLATTMLLIINSNLRLLKLR